MRVTIHDAARAALLALALAPWAAFAAEDGSVPARGGAVRITVEPRRIAVGQSAAALRIEAPAAVGALTLSSNAGTVDQVAPAGPGVFTARYVAPAERVPRVAIVAALGHAGSGALVDGWVAIPIDGTGRARIQGKPGAEIALRIGDRTFGPVVADAAGRAVVAVVVPPGVREAHQGFVPVDLGVPETSLLHVVGGRATIPAEAGGEVPFRAYVVAPHGAARRGDVPAFAPTRGTVVYSEREPGAIEGVWRLPPGPAGEARLAVSLPGAPASRASLRVEAVPGPPVLVANAGLGGIADDRGPHRGLTFSVSAALLAARGIGAPSVDVAVERGAEWLDPALALRVDLRVASWTEARADRALAAALVGFGARHGVGRSLELWSGVGLGLAVGGGDGSGGGAGPAAGATVGLGVPRAWGTPFLELGALAASDVVPGHGPFGAVTLGAGIRFDVGSRASSAGAGAVVRAPER